MGFSFSDNNSFILYTGGQQLTAHCLYREKWSFIRIDQHVQNLAMKIS